MMNAEQANATGMFNLTNVWLWVYTFNLIVFIGIEVEFIEWIFPDSKCLEPCGGRERGATHALTHLCIERN